jgi:serine protease AprX
MLLGAPAGAAAESALGKFDRVASARSRELTGRSRVIVQFHGAPDVRAITGNHGVAGRTLDSIDARVAEIDNVHLRALAADPRVRRIAIDRGAFGTLERTGAAIGAALVRRELGLTGRGIGVAVVDSGISAFHADLTDRVRGTRAGRRVVYFKDFTTRTRGHADRPSDGFGHGTHVAGIIAGNGYYSDGARTGIAPGASLIGLKVLDAEGHGYVSDIIAAIDHAIGIRNVYNIRVMNVSVASGVYESYETDLVAQATRRAVEAGIVVVASAGNLGTDAAGHVRSGGITSPGNAPWVLTVGAFSHEGTAGRHDDVLASFTSRGPTRFDHVAKPDIVAPGVGIESLVDARSAFYSTYADYLLDGTRPSAHKPYLSLSGTSMSAPVVAGTVALMLETSPDLTPNAVKAILQYTAEKRTGESLLSQGAGLLNARGAIRMAQFFASPSQGIPEPVDRIEGELIAWSQEIIWGDKRFAGGVPLPGASAWSVDVPWGAESGDGSRPLVFGVEAAAADGSLWAEMADGSLWAEMDDGSLWAESDDGSLWAESDDGSLWAEMDEGSLWAESDEGSLWAEAGQGFAWLERKRK